MIFDIDLMIFLLFVKIVDVDVDRCHPILRRKRISLPKTRLNHKLILRSVLVVSESERPDPLRRISLSLDIPVTIIFVDKRRILDSWLPFFVLQIHPFSTGDSSFF